MHKKILGSGHNNTTTLIMSNNEIEHLENSGSLLKGITVQK